MYCNYKKVAIHRKIISLKYLSLDHSFKALKCKSPTVFSLMDITRHALPTTENPVVRYQQAELDERAMKALLRKIDLRLIPLLILLNFFTFLDRINIGNKRISI